MGVEYGEARQTDLTVDAVCDKAIERTGLDDFGPLDFHDRLAVQLGEMDADLDGRGLVVSCSSTIVSAMRRIGSAFRILLTRHLRSVTFRSSSPSSSLAYLGRAPPTW